MTFGDDEGFTLVESVIAMLIMAVAIVTIVGGLTTMITLTGGHRGHAVAETANRSFAQAVVEQGRARTAVRGPGNVNAGTQTIPVTDARLFPGAGPDTFVVVGREVMQVTAVNRSTAPTLTVVRGVGGTSAAAHQAGASVASLLRCPSADALRPREAAQESLPVNAAYHRPRGSTSSLTSVTYWVPNDTGAWDFRDRPACLTHFAQQCLGGDIRPGCDTGLARVAISTVTTNDSRYLGAETTTTVLVRRGGF